MSNNLQGDDSSMPALVSAGEDLPADEDKGEESQGVTNGNKVQATFMWYQFSQDVVDPATLLSTEKVCRDLSALKSMSAFVCVCVCVCVRVHVCVCMCV